MRCSVIFICTEELVLTMLLIVSDDLIYSSKDLFLGVIFVEKVLLPTRITCTFVVYSLPRTHILVICIVPLKAVDRKKIMVIISN